MAARTVRFHHKDGKQHTEPMATFAKANGTDMRGARRILELWQEKGWIERRKDGGFDVKNRRPRKDKWTMDKLREEGYPAPQHGPDYPAVTFVDEVAAFHGESTAATS